MSAKLAYLTIARTTAARACLQRQPRQVSSDRFLVKSALITAFGRNTIRPWRILVSNPTTLIVLGYLSDPGATITSHPEYGISVELLDTVLPKTGEVVRFSAELFAMKPNGARKKGGTLRPARMIGVQKKEINAPFDDKARDAAILEWLGQQFGKPERGLANPVIESFAVGYETYHFSTSDGRRPTPIQIVTAVISGTVADQALFGQYLTGGVGRGRDFGLGTSYLIYDDVQAEVA